MIIDPKNHYWIVGGAADRVYSSATNSYVAADDAGYTQWLSAFNRPTPILNEAELWEVLSTYAPGYLPAWLFDGTSFVQPAPGAYTKAQLKAYTASARYDREIRGITVGGVAVLTDRQSQSMVSNAFSYLSKAPAGTTADYKGASGWVSLTAAQLEPIALAVGTHVQACFSAERLVGEEIDSGAVKTPAAIDAALAAALGG